MRRFFIAALLLLLAGCGGGSGSSVSTGTSGQNKAAISVDGTFGVVNRAYTNVTICAPGTNNCQTIDHVLIDTGSVGLRLLSTPAIAALNLASQNTSAGNQLGECYFYVSSYVWGSARLADVKMGGETASNIAVHIVADPAMPAAPNYCSSTGGAAQSTSAAMNANGIMGIGVTPADCGSGCSLNPANNRYYTCGATSCTSTAVPLAQQVGNPVAQFAQDNNGVIMQLPSISSAGAVNATGQLIFGIGTQADNALGSAQVYATNLNGDITTVYNGTSYPDSFIDSGTNRYSFNDSSLPLCAGTVDYCPASPTALSAVNVGGNGINGTVNFNVANVNSLFGAGNFAQNDRAGPISALGAASFLSTSFDWGLPFFYGRSLFVAFNGRSTPGGAGPYYAY
ncbi:MULTISPECIES: DUF3443 domain-containing protein [Paraburkholderia]|uniref:DUF3443 domain-containing protein n=2 Tax=Paraburkholderia TaxID=1822464 RepID=A0A7Y9WN28_9BURK|nr:DUF3443 domain-containing protein [Paraburkholderia bryophila]NYH23939.1 hypothetical protein [Paraburkholderia bryophila]